MSSFPIILSAIIPVFLVIIAGFGSRKAGWIACEADSSLTRLVLYLLNPCLVLHSTIGNKSLSHPGSIILAAGLGFATLCIGVLVAYLFSGLIGDKSRASQRTFALSAGCQNYSYIPIPLAMALFDRDTVGMIFVFAFGFDIAFWTVGVATLVGGLKPSSCRKMLTNPGLMAVLVGIGLNALGAEQWMPGTVMRLFEWLGACCIPIALLLAGMTMADYTADFHPRSAIRVIAVSTAARIVVLGAILLAMAAFLPMPGTLRNVMILQAAMPAAIFPIIMARYYGGNPMIAIKVTFGTSVLSLITAPLIIDFALRHIR